MVILFVMTFVCFEKKLSFSKDLKKIFHSQSILSFGEIRSPLQISEARGFFIDLSFPADQIQTGLEDIHHKTPIPPVYFIYNNIQDIRDFPHALAEKFPSSFLSLSQIKNGHFLFTESQEEKTEPAFGMAAHPHNRYWHWETLEELLSLYQNQSVNENNLLKWISHYLQSERLVLYKRTGQRFDFISALKCADEAPFSSLHFLETDPLVQKLKYRQSCIALSGWVSQINPCGKSLESLILSMKMVGVLLLETTPEHDYLLFFNHRETGLCFTWEEVFNVKKISEYLLSKRSPPLTSELITSDNLKQNEPESSPAPSEILPDLSRRVSNEFKNAIVSIQTFTQLLPEKYKDPHFRKDFFTIVEKEVSRLENLLDRIAFFQSPYVPAKQHFLLHNLLSECISAVSKLIGKSDIKFNYHVDRAFSFYGEEEKLSFAIKEILINAIQATQSGTKPQAPVTLTVQHENSATARLSPNIKISVTDEGNGVSHDIQKQLFKPFNSNKSSGLGVGLLFAKTIIDAHHGQLELGRTSSQGTAWEIFLPSMEPSMSTPFAYKDRAGDN